MIRRGRRQWNQNTRLPPRAQLRHRHRARARDHEIGRGIGGGDRIKEPAHDDAAGHGSRRVQRFVQRTGAPEQIDIAERAAVEGAHDSFIQGARALTAAHDEQCAPLATQTEIRARGARIDVTRWRDRISEHEHLGARARREFPLRFGEAEMHLSCATRKQSRGETRECVLLLQRGRKPRELRAQHDRPRRISARADHDRGLFFAQDTARRPPGVYRDHRPAEIAPPRSPIERLHGQQMKPERMTREDLRFNASLGADERDIVSGFGRDLRQYQGRHEVATGAAAGDEKLHNKQMRNAECGMRNFWAEVEVALCGSNPTFTFRIPQFAFRIMPSVLSQRSLTHQSPPARQ